MHEFTSSQKKAIETRGKPLVVSAGAGSGKTTVLTQRIIRGIEEGGDIDDILVVTFTKAAASDMKEKLYTALSAASAENIENRRLAEMSLKISSARISTISSFCFGFVRENFEQLGLSPKLRMADDGETKPIMEECLANTEEEAFENDDGDMLLLADSLGGDKNLNRLGEIILELYDRFRSAPFWKTRFDDALDKRREEAALCKKNGFFASPSGKSIMSEILHKLNSLKIRAEKLLEFAEIYATSEKHLTVLQKLCDDISSLCELDCGDYSAFRDAVNGFTFGRLYNVGMERDAVEHITREKRFITERMTKLKAYFAFTDERIESDWNRTIELNTALRNILFKFDDAYTAAKNRRGICDYADVEHLTLKLLGRRTPGGIVRTELCKRYSEGIREIYVDEYQDVNPLQDMIFSLLSRDNYFFVGDVKQSVYRFRNASAKIFGDRVKNAADIDTGGDTCKIFLRENFRSTANIINFVNCLFEKLYTPENTGYSYAEEKLVCASGETCHLPVEVSCITDAPAGGRDECEATVAAARIISMVGKGRRADGRALNYGDFAVLLRSAAGKVSEYERVFRRYGIPFSAENNNSFLELPEVMLVISLLTVIDDSTDEIALAASLRSPAFGFDAEELREVRMFRPDLPFYFAVSACAREYVRKTRHITYHCRTKIIKPLSVVKRQKTSRGIRPDIKTLRKCSEFIRFAGAFSEYALELPSHKLIWKLYEALHLTEIISCYDNGDEKKNNLMKLYRIAVSYESGSFRGLSAFLEYIKNASDSVDAADSSSEECVHIMTFHKSKGLEFPVCIVCGTGSRFNVNDLRLPYVVCDDGFVCFDLREASGLCAYQPLIKLAAAAKEKNEMLCEELRCLYVALTRAREQLYVIGCFDGDAEEIADKSFLDLGSNMERIINALNDCHSNSFSVEVLMGDALPSPEALRHDGKTETVQGEIRWLEYNYNDACLIPAKVAVSELHPGLFENDEYERSVSHSAVLKIPAFADGGRCTPAEMGTATHMFMQFCSFERIENDGVRAEAERLAADGLISKTDLSGIRFGEVETFFKSTLYAEMKKSNMCRREMRFTLAEDSASLGEVSGETILVQGVIDCFFENTDGTYTVLDYKTDRLPHNNGEEILIRRHKTQLTYYCRAVEKITGGKVSRAVLYSFALGKSVDVEMEL